MRDGQGMNERFIFHPSMENVSHAPVWLVWLALGKLKLHNKNKLIIIIIIYHFLSWDNKKNSDVGITQVELVKLQLENLIAFLTSV